MRGVICMVKRIPRWSMSATLKTLLLLFWALTLLLPLCAMLSSLIGTDVGAIITGRNFRKGLGNSLNVSCVSTVISIALAWCLAWCTTRTRIRFKGLFMILFSLPMLIPSISHGMGLIILFGRNGLVTNLLAVIEEKGYRGLDVDFEFLDAGDAQPYAQFISRLREALAPMGLPVIVALAPKVFAAQPGRLYEGHNYGLLSQAADFVLLMTYEWGYTYGPPMAVAPIRNVRQVVDYALTEMPPEKIYLGIPNYGYDWPLPFRQGSRATSISNQYAVELAARNNVAIRYDERAQAPWFRYVDGNGREHEVWFEDARSIRAKLALAREYGLYGVGYWNLMRPFPQNWVVLNALYNIREEG